MGSREAVDAVTGPAPVSRLDVERWSGGDSERLVDELADEHPVTFRYSGIAHVVMLATPRDLRELAIGFTLSEGIVSDPGEIRSVEVLECEGALEVHLEIAARRFADLLQRRRHLSSRGGCGLCGTESLEHAIRTPQRLPVGLALSSRQIQSALAELPRHQPLNARTGAVHAAAWVLPSEGLQLVMEDVGRHNALDKLIGALVERAEALSRGYLIMTSRASYEIVQKAATVGISAIVSVSAPTAFAVRAARDCGLTLIGFARPGRHVVYAHCDRLGP
jgi:formate dehydrogenase accessory protein FdhD